MSTGLRLSDCANTPLYNIKAVVQVTGISPSTLRAWERRYNMCRPQRSENGYRLYAERDVAVIRWLKTQVDAGMSISQAVAWLEKLAQEADGMAHVILPGATESALSPSLGSPTATAREQVRGFDALRRDLRAALLDYDENAAGQVIAEAFAIYPVEQIGEQLFHAVSTELSRQRQAGALNSAAEQYATTYLCQRLAALLHMLPNQCSGPLLWVACAPSEPNEIGALLLGVYLRHAGYHIHYLGPSSSCDDLVGEAQRRQPAMVLFSASTQTAAEEVGELAAQLASISHDGRQRATARPIIGYGGPAFKCRPDLYSAIAGVFLGESAQCAARRVDQLLLERQQPSQIQA